MRYCFVANKGTDVVYFSTDNEIEAFIKAWDYRMMGYTVKVGI